MPVRVISSPEPVVTLDDAKAFLRVDHADDNEMIDDLIVAAQSEIDGPLGWLGRAIGLQTLEATFDSFHSWMPLPYPDLKEIVSVFYINTAGASATASAALYEIVGNAIRLKSGATWPAVTFGCDSVRVQYKASTELDEAALERMKLAIKMHVRGHYDREGDAWRGAFDALLSSLRKFG